ncbi:MAG: hypothetical protein M3169_12925 [Candidatus Eremiobacteraeota bacterium]|nr:hypothetical protein [Candidatus Eremiobacteraeota bacterium]
MSSGFNWAIILDIGVGVGVLLIGIGIFIVCSSLAKIFARLNGTLDEVDRQIGALSVPVLTTLNHVGGIADTADATVARLGAVVGTLEGVAGTVGNTAKLATEAVTPGLVNLGATLSGITAGLRRLITGRRGAPTDGSISPGAAKTSDATLSDVTPSGVTPGGV